MNSAGPSQSWCSDDLSLDYTVACRLLPPGLSPGTGGLSVPAVAGDGGNASLFPLPWFPGTSLHSVMTVKGSMGGRAAWRGWPGKSTVLGAPPEALILWCFTPKEHVPNSECQSTVFSQEPVIAGWFGVRAAAGLGPSTGPDTCALVTEPLASLIWKPQRTEPTSCSCDIQ